MAKEKGALEVLFPGVKVGGYDVKPWTFKQAKILMPSVSRVVGALRKWYADGGGVGTPDLTPQGLEEAMKRFPPEKILGELLPTLMEEATEITTVSLGIDQEKFEEMDFGDASALFLSIMAENMDYIKNFFGPAGKGKA